MFLEGGGVKVYRITNWESLFETYETKKLAHLKWVPVPNKHDGLGFRRVAAQKNRCELFAAWNLILQVASKGRKQSDRGTLRRDGKALTPSDLSIMTGFPESIFEAALNFFSSPQMGWLEVEEQWVTDKTADHPAKTEEGSGPTCERPAEWNGMEGNGKNTPEVEVSPPPFYNEARIILGVLNEKSGSHFREVDANLSLIAARLKSCDCDMEGVKAMVERQCKLWRHDPRMDRFLQPTTLFGPENFEKYYGSRFKPAEGYSPPQQHGPPPPNLNARRKNEADFIDHRAVDSPV